MEASVLWSPRSITLGHLTRTCAIDHTIHHANGYIIHDWDGVKPCVLEVWIGGGHINIRKVCFGIWWRFPTVVSLTVLSFTYRHARRTCDRANIGETGCAGDCKREVGAVGEKDDDDRIGWQEQCPFPCVLASSQVSNTVNGETENLG